MEQIPDGLCLYNLTEGLCSPGDSADLPYFFNAKVRPLCIFLHSFIERQFNKGMIGPVQRPSGLEYGLWHWVQILVLSLFHKVTEPSDLNSLGLDFLLY